MTTFAPIYTVTRADRPEVAVDGVIYVCAGPQTPRAAGRSLLHVGDARFRLWSRSLLKPWQLMVIYPTLRRSYPALTEAHLALMTASHSGDARQIRLLEEVLHVGDISEQALRCPPRRAMPRAGGSTARALDHTCSGKHLGYLLHLRAENQSLRTYLAPEAEPYRLLHVLLGHLLGRDDFEIATDGCGMPTFALSAMEMAGLYHSLAMPPPEDVVRHAPDELKDILTCWEDVSLLMRRYPELVGGEGRLDTRLMQGGWHRSPAVPVLAKEGADGLLGVGIGANHLFAGGLGFCVKLASGYHPTQLETIALELLAQLGLREPGDEDENDDGTVRTRFHFRLGPVAASA